VYAFELYPYDEEDPTLSKNVEIFNRMLSTLSFVE